MTGRAWLLVLAIAAFGVLTALALEEAGYLGIFTQPLQSWAGTQVLVDLAILALLGCVWLAGDARARGIPAWPFVALTFAAGSFGVLFYLLVRERAAKRRAAA